jgi:hypothetical protein
MKALQLADQLTKCCRLSGTWSAEHNMLAGFDFRERLSAKFANRGVRRLGK